jgi:hypothetical protein
MNYTLTTMLLSLSYSTYTNENISSSAIPGVSVELLKRLFLSVFLLTFWLESAMGCPRDTYDDLIYMINVKWRVYVKRWCTVCNCMYAVCAHWFMYMISALNMYINIWVRLPKCSEVRDKCWGLWIILDVTPMFLPVYGNGVAYIQSCHK